MKSNYKNMENQYGEATAPTYSDVQEEDAYAHHANHHNNNKFNYNFLTSNTTAPSTYDSLQRPYKNDPQRGQWSNAADFYFACTNHAFGSLIFSEIPVYIVISAGVYALIPFLLAILLCAIPIFAIQTFLGQFSSSGNISALRVAPVFKGIGYAIILLNLIALTYYAVVAAVPMIYAVHSLHTVIPWMNCDNRWNTANCSTHTDYDAEMLDVDPHATTEFFSSLIRNNNENTSNYSISWSLLYGVFSVWILTLGFLLKPVSFIGKFFRFTYVIMVAIFIAIFGNIMTSTEMSWSIILDMFSLNELHTWEIIQSGLISSVYMATWLLGPGWGSVLTLASHNKFKCDSESITYWVSGTHVLMAIMAMICGRVALDHFEAHVGLLHFHVEEEHHLQFVYIAYAYYFGSYTNLPNFWSFLFFAMLFFAEICAVIIQSMTVLTAIFDEFECLRNKKPHITVLFATTMFLASIYFCTKQGFGHLNLLPNSAVLTCVILYFIILIVITWVYGRKRFQCDLQFMLGKTISNVKIFLLRFVTPILLILCMIQLAVLVDIHSEPISVIIATLSLAFGVSLGYAIYKMCQTTGSLQQRLQQCLLPHDWYPAYSGTRSYYEDVMGISEMLVFREIEFTEPADA